MSKTKAIEFYTETVFRCKDTANNKRTEEEIQSEVAILKKNIKKAIGFFCPLCGKRKRFYHVNITESDVEYPFYCGYCETSFLIADSGGAI